MKIDTFQKRNITLDSIRGIAILLVLFNHAFLPENTAGDFGYSILYRIMDAFKRGGWTGVDLFFVMSGFLVSGLIFKEYKATGSLDISRFIIRRGFKIYPSFVLFIVVASGIEIMYNSGAFPVIDYVKDLFFLHNYLHGRWGQTWSLDVEEFFYLTFPFLFSALIFGGRRLSLKQFLAIYAGLVIISMIGRFFANYNQPYSFGKQFTMTHFRLDSIFFGVLIGYVYHFKSEIINHLMRYRYFILPIAIAIVAANFIIWKGGMRAVVTLSSNAVCYGILMMYAYKKNLLNIKPLAYIGKHSYNIYLWHYPLFYYSVDIIKWMGVDVNTFSGFASYLAVYVIVGVFPGILMTKIIEDPFLKIRDKYFPSRRNLNL